MKTIWQKGDFNNIVDKKKKMTLLKKWLTNHLEKEFSIEFASKMKFAIVQWDWEDGSKKGDHIESA